MQPTTPSAPAGTPRRRTRALALTLPLLMMLALASGGAAITPASASAGSVAAGDRHSCAIKEPGGEVWCWGDNSDGALGSGTQEDSAVPVRVSNLSGAIAVTAGEDHSCAVRTDGTAWCWGGNSYGQLGDASEDDRSVPAQVAGITGATAIAAGARSSCAIHSGGAVSCWGDNGEGVLGHGDSMLGESAVAVAVQGISNASGITMGDDHACALLATGGVRCWGSNRDGKLGIAPATSRSYAPAADVAGIGGATAVSAGDDFTCAVRSAGSVVCWGDNWSGQLGDGTDQNARHAPAPVSGLPNGAAAIAAGDNFACAALLDGSSWCWGTNSYGELGAGSTADKSSVPIALAGAGAAHEVVAGSGHACLRSRARAVQCWGHGDYGQLGQGRTVDVVDPSPVTALPAATDVAATVESSCALHSAGQVSCWGWGRYGIHGAGPDRTGREPSPVPVSGISDAQAIAAGRTHVCALREGTPARAISCWGTNNAGQLGSPAGAQKNLPAGVNVAGQLEADPGSGFLAITAGTDFTCVLLARVSGNGVRCWGAGGQGQLGDGTTANTHLMAQVNERLGLEFVMSQTDGPTIASGARHTCVVSSVSGGTVWCWGDNTYGQLGSGGGSGQSSAQPLQVPGVTGVVSVAAGGNHSCALLTDRTVQCWGVALAVGNGSSGFAVTGPVTALVSNVQAIAAGASQTCAATTDGRLHCWGVRRDGVHAPSALAYAPSAVAGVSSVATAALQQNHSCALAADGVVSCWGSAVQGAIGDGPMPAGHYPIQRTPTNVVGFGPVPASDDDRDPRVPHLPGPPVGPGLLPGPDPTPEPAVRPSAPALELRDSRLHVRGLSLLRTKQARSCPKQARMVISGRVSKRTIKSTRSVKLRRAGERCAATATLRITGRLAKAAKLTLRVTGKGLRASTRKVTAKTSARLRGGRLRLDGLAVRATSQVTCPETATITIAGPTKATRRHRLTRDLKVALAPVSGCTITGNIKLTRRLASLKKVSITLHGDGLRTTKRSVSTV